MAKKQERRVSLGVTVPESLKRRFEENSAKLGWFGTPNQQVNEWLREHVECLDAYVRVQEADAKREAEDPQHNPR